MEFTINKIYTIILALFIILMTGCGLFRAEDIGISPKKFEERYNNYIVELMKKSNNDDFGQLMIEKKSAYDNGEKMGNFITKGEEEITWMRKEGTENMILITLWDRVYFGAPPSQETRKVIALAMSYAISGDFNTFRELEKEFNKALKDGKHEAFIKKDGVMYVISQEDGILKFMVSIEVEK